ncbi:MAG: NAD(P)-binding domain-containing protein, partial [Thaumarchaeota archaeon]|nr:NAD(P)-binding domain-containing protein [Nitrososphaerota archaeon]
GGGQAGLSASYHLKQLGREHLVLEQGEIGNTWKAKRWDSFTLVTPNWTVQLPGVNYDGREPDGYMPRDEIVAYLRRYADKFELPVRSGIRVESLDRTQDGRKFLLKTNAGIFGADNVIVASGPFQIPKIPRMSSNISSEVLQISPDQYKNQRDLPTGGVLVVGTGQSGCQIAEELNHNGRMVYLTTSSCGRVPRTYRGKDIIWWMNELGQMDDLVDNLQSPGMKFSCNPHLSGKDGGHEINLRKLSNDGVILLGYLEDIQNNKIILAPNLEGNLAKADGFASDACKRIDEYIEKTAWKTASQEATQTNSILKPVNEAIPILDLGSAGIKTVIWATGYDLDFSWIHIPVFDERGYPIHKRGITTCPGLYFLGLHWLYKRKSCLLLGVGEDGAYLASNIPRS